MVKLDLSKEWFESMIDHDEPDDITAGRTAAPVVTLDPQKRLGEETWLVSIPGDGTLEGDDVQLGLFWRRDAAEIFRRTIIHRYLYP